MVEPTANPDQLQVNAPSDVSGGAAPDQSALPAQGAPPAAQPSILSGTSIGDAVAKAFLTHTANEVQKASAETDAKRMVPKPPIASPAAQPMGEDQPSPGSFAERLQNAIGGTLGDAAHASDTKGGWLSGVVNTLRARDQRLAQQRKDDALIARTQVETLAMHRNMFRADQAAQQDFQKANQAYVDTYKQNHNVEEGVTFEQLQKMRDQEGFFQNHIVRETGSEPLTNADGTTQKDKYGDPITAPTYAVITRATNDGAPDDKTLTPEQAADYEKFTGKKMPAGTRLTTPQYDAVNVQTTSARNLVTSLQNANGKDFTPDQIKTIQPYVSSPTVLQAASEVPGSPYAGVKQHIDNADAHIAALNVRLAAAQKAGNQKLVDATQADIKAFQKEKSDLEGFTRAAISPKQIEEYNKRTGDLQETIADLQKRANTAHGEEAAAMAESTQQLIDQHPEYSDAVKKTLSSIVTQTQAAAKASQDWETEKERNKQKVSNALNDDDIPVLVDSALNYDINPDQYSKRKDTSAKFHAAIIREAQARGIHWSDSEYKQRYNMKQDLAKDTPTSMGGQVDALNRFGLHTGRANDGIQGLRNIGSPILNTALNKIKENMTGFPEAQAFKIEAEAVKDEFLNLVKNGRVPMSEEEARLAANVNENRTPAELQGIFRSMAQLVADRARSMNGRYNTIFGGGDASIPGLLQPDTVKTLQMFGVDTDSVLHPNTVSRTTNPSMVVGSKVVPGASPSPASKPGSIVAGQGKFQGKIGVITPDGQTQYFDSQQQADNFKKLAKLQ